MTWRAKTWRKFLIIDGTVPSVPYRHTDYLYLQLVSIFFGLLIADGTVPILYIPTVSCILCRVDKLRVPILIPMPINCMSACSNNKWCHKGVALN